MQKDALVLGGGIAGLQATLQLADSGYPVSLVTDEATLGGKLAAADLPPSQAGCLWEKALNISALYLGGNLHASPAIISLLMLRATNHPRIRIFTHARLTGLQGKEGDFLASIGDAATGRQVAEIAAGSVILAAGFAMVDAAEHGEYGYSRYRNVITSLELERLLALSRRGDSIRRPSDGGPVKNVAFIQCVGSRTAAGREYCSSLCCTFTAKEAILLSELDPAVRTSVFYIDTRAGGKNFDQFLQRAKDLGVRYVRSMISAVKEDPVTENLLLRYFAAGKNQQQEFDMVVLAVGMQPPPALAETAALLGIALNDYGFVAVNQFQPVLTSRTGIFVAGGGQGLLEVGETLTLASSAATMASYLLAPPEKPAGVQAWADVGERECPRTGVYLCSGGLSAANIDPTSLAESLMKIPGVVVAAAAPLLCMAPGISQMRQSIAANRIDRAVIAPCLLRANQFLFQEALATAGVNPLLVETAGLPPTGGDALPPAAAVKEAIAVAVANLKTCQPLRWHPEPVIPRALVVGGGISGMAAALAVADGGFPVTIIERRKALGGFLADYPEDGGLRRIFQEIRDRVHRHKNIEILTDCRVVAYSGRQGHFTSLLACGETPAEAARRLEHGVTILATGTTEYSPEEYLCGTDSRVMIGTQAWRIMQQGGLPARKAATYAFIQCVGSRSKERPYCSRNCCLRTVDSALAVKSSDPDAQIYVFYRDIRTPGFSEKRYRQARHAGVIFVNFPDDSPPTLARTADGELVISALDAAAGEMIDVRPDAVILAAGEMANPDAVQTARLFKLQANPEGFLLEPHSNIGTIAFPNGGIFAVGSAHGPKPVAECLAQAQGVAARAIRILSRPFLRMGGMVAEVDAEKCAACLTCVRVCPFGVPVVDREHKAMGSARIAPAECRGCGVCAAECPAGAIEQSRYETDRLKERIAIALAEGEES
jgi:heterodisulfide reductase subunit A